jgi:hypothetical protein
MRRKTHFRDIIIWAVDCSWVLFYLKKEREGGCVIRKTLPTYALSTPCVAQPFIFPYTLLFFHSLHFLEKIPLEFEICWLCTSSCPLRTTSSQPSLLLFFSPCPPLRFLSSFPPYPLSPLTKSVTSSFPFLARLSLRLLGSPWHCIPGLPTLPSSLCPTHLALLSLSLLPYKR